MQKGCIFEFSHEFDLVRELIQPLISNDCKDILLNKISSEILTAFIEATLNSKLSDYYREKMTITNIIHDVLDTSFNGQFDIDALYAGEEYVFEISRILEARLFEMFRSVDVTYALWQVRALSSYIRVVEYLGDYRIMEWHERSGIPYQGECTDLRYEFSLSSIYTALGKRLEPHCGKYAGHYLNKYLDVIIRNLMEESIFLNGNRVTDESRHHLASLVNDEVIISDYPYSREKIEQAFPLMSQTEIHRVVNEMVGLIETELSNAIRAAADVDDVKSWFISDRVLTIQINRPLSKVDFGERLKVDIKASMDNGDWVPPKLRHLANL